MTDEQRARELLAEVYEPEGVNIWLAATHKSGPLVGRCPNDMFTSGEGAAVVSAANSLAAGAW
jgi:hypothetical protein